MVKVGWNMFVSQKRVSSVRVLSDDQIRFCVCVRRRCANRRFHETRTSVRWKGVLSVKGYQGLTFNECDSLTVKSLVVSVIVAAIGNVTESDSPTSLSLVRRSLSKGTRQTSALCTSPLNILPVHLHQRGTSVNHDQTRNRVHRWLICSMAIHRPHQCQTNLLLFVGGSNDHVCRKVYSTPPDVVKTGLLPPL